MTLKLAINVAMAGLALVAQASPLQPIIYDADFQRDMLAAHNYFRDQHGSPNVTWDTDAEANAQAWANQCQFQHQACIPLLLPLPPFLDIQGSSSHKHDQEQETR